MTSSGPRIRTGALIAVSSFAPDLVILDVMLPDLSGFELGRVLRHGGKTPIIILSARGEKADKLEGLRLGADDYVTKPFDMEELVARIHTVLRRVKPSVGMIQLGTVTIDFRRGLASGENGDLRLDASRVRNPARARRTPFAGGLSRRALQGDLGVCGFHDHALGGSGGVAAAAEN